MGHKHSAIEQTRVSGKQMRLPDTAVFATIGNCHANTLPLPLWTPRPWHTICLFLSHGENVDSISQNFFQEQGFTTISLSRVGKTAGFDEKLCVHRIPPMNLRFPARLAWEVN